ncbi:MAG: hypothetical protein WCK09_05425 [Bacteroidota bacterium]
MQNRRNFIQTLARGTIFASLTFLSGIFIHRWSEAGDCEQNFTCGNCKLSNRCKLPEADQYRLEKARSPKSKTANGRAGK